MTSVYGLYALIFVAVFVGALAVVTLVGGVPVLFWYVKRW